MAAILCESVGKLCNSCCSCLAVPCQACGEATSKLLCSPFAPYLGVTLILNLPPVLWGLQSLGTDCTTWLLMNAILCAGHIAGSWYIAHKIQSDPELETLIPVTVGDATPSTPFSKADNDKPTYTTAQAVPMHNGATDQVTGHANSTKRLTQVLCYDPGTAVYLLVCLFWVGWQMFGYSQIGEEGCSHVTGSLMCGMIYGMLVVCTFACSLLCLR